MAFRRSNVYSLFLVAVVAALSWVHVQAPIKYVKVVSRSMSDTLLPGDRLIFWLRDRHKRLCVRRGDILLIQDPEDRSGLITKRLIALPGELVRVVRGLVFINGTLLHEPYLAAAHRRQGYSMNTLRVPRGRVFVLGDNRSNSMDSVTWGPVPFGMVEGRALACYWPCQRLGIYFLHEPSNPRKALSAPDRDQPVSARP